MRARRRDRTGAAGSAGNEQSGRERNRGGGAKPAGSSQRNQRQRGSSSGGSRDGSGSGGASRKKSASQRGRRRGRGRSPAQESASFWGRPASLPTEQPEVRITDAPAAVPRSLGRPPLPGHETIAEHYFGVVYERAVSTSGALAAAGGLVDPAALVEELSD